MHLESSSISLILTTQSEHILPWTKNLKLFFNFLSNTQTENVSATDLNTQIKYVFC